MKYSEKNKPIECMMTQSTCYKNTRKMEVLGVLWHSTGANNPNVKRYVQPSDNDPNKATLLATLGKNIYKNDWNHSERSAGLNAFIGKLANGTVAAVQTMPWDYRPWGCGAGSKGSCNNGWIQFEICEDNLKNESYFNKIYEEACQLTAYLCKLYNLDPLGKVKTTAGEIPVILDHATSNKLGMGSNHGDIAHWFSKYGKTIEDVRQYVNQLVNGTKPTTVIEFKAGDLVKVTKEAVYWSGKKVPVWVTAQNWYLHSVATSGRAVIGQNEKKNANIMSPIDIKFLTKVQAFTAYKIKVIANTLNYRAGAGLEYKIKGSIKKNGIYTIIEEKTDNSGYTWGKLKSGAGWIRLDYTIKC